MIEPRPERARWALLATMPALLLLAWQASWPWPFFSDDAFISLRYADRLLHGHGLTWTDGVRVEGYSNLLWVLLTAGLGALGIDLVTAARLLGGACSALALWFVARAMRPFDLHSALRASLPPLLVAATGTVLVWTLGGLEGPLLMMLLAWGFGAVAQRLDDGGLENGTRADLLLLGVPFALACLARPDSPLWVLAIGIVLTFANRRDGQRPAFGRACWFALPAVAATLLQLAFRVVYYGDFVPNTAHVKAEFHVTSFGPGMAYVRAALLTTPGLTVLALLGGLLLAWRRSTRALAAGLLLPLLFWFVYLASIGGDHFPGHRLLHGALPVMALGFAFALRNASRTRMLLLAGLALGAIGIDTWCARSDAGSKEARAEDWEWHGKQLGELLARAFADQQPRLAVDAAGAVPYYSKLPALDLLGLCDHTIATTPFPAWLQTMRPEIPRPPGHLRGNGRYVLDQAPDLMLFSSPPGLPLPVFVSGAELEEDPRFRADYRCVLVDVPAQDRLTPLWVRVDGKAGVQRTAAQIEIPAWLFGSYALPEPLIRRHQPASGDAAGEVLRAQHLAELAAWYGSGACVAVPAQLTGELQLAWRSGPDPELELALPQGNWRVVEPSPAIATLAVVGTAESTIVRGNDAQPTRLRLHVVHKPPTTAVPRVVLERTPD